MVSRPLQKLGGDSPFMSTGVRGKVFIEEFTMGLIDPRWVGRWEPALKAYVAPLNHVFSWLRDNEIFNRDAFNFAMED